METGARRICSKTSFGLLVQGAGGDPDIGRVSEARTHFSGIP